MPIFLTTDQVYRIIQRELPGPDVYPDGPASAFYSTADSYATAKTVGDAYSSLESIYDNYFPQYATDRMSDWEELVLGRKFDNSVPLQERRNRVIERLRTRRRTTQQDMISVVHTVIDSSILVEIAPWGCGCAGWVLDVSQLDISTILNEFNNLNRVGPLLCQLSAADFGLTADEFARYQEEAYTYEVRIYGYTLSNQERSDIDAALNDAEPARSRHLIIDGLDPADALGGDL